ncbi:MAG: type II toxin-antitoxin system RelE/ParE family toxin [Elusimicrobiota bacterium]|jgi:putative addiction module killer protein|nr:type II toxin-antitoxin system RelE/ParE family toxin [Elusimicrobiota bacterium]
MYKILYINNKEQKKLILYPTKYYKNWFKNLKDFKTKERIETRINRLQEGYCGVIKQVGTNIKELKFYFGSGYRVYIAEYKSMYIILLVGGEKNTQQKDIEKAKIIFKEYQKIIDEEAKNGK